MKLITKPIAEKLIKGYRHSAETGESGKDVLVKFFTPWANATWFITEGMPVDAEGESLSAPLQNWALAADWHLFGFCDLGDRLNAELGYVMLSDLTGIKGPFGLRVERDRHYAKPIADVLKAYGRVAAA